jgi:hypothetical protein
MPRADRSAAAPLLASVEVPSPPAVAVAVERHESSAGGPAPEPVTIVFATPLPAPAAVLMAVTVATAAAPARPGSRTGRTAREHTRAGIRAVMAANRFSAAGAGAAAGAAADASGSRPYFAAATPGPRRVCQTEGTWQACLRDGTRMCQRCNKWMCVEHTYECEGAA